MHDCSFENYANPKMAKIDSNFISIGIVPLHYSFKCVASGSLSYSLKSSVNAIPKKIYCLHLPLLTLYKHDFLSNFCNDHLFFFMRGSINVATVPKCTLAHKSSR